MPNSYWFTTLYLVRHGQARATDGSYGNDTPLSQLGHEQAQAVATAFTPRVAPTAVYTSPYPRASATAQFFCRQYGITLTVDARLAEFEMSPTTLENIQQNQGLALWRPDHCGIPEGETLGTFSERVASSCKDIVFRHARSSVVVFTHAGVIDAALRWAVGLTPDSIWQHDFDLATASVTEIEVWPHGRGTDGAPRHCVVRRVGDVSHLGRLVSDI